MTALGSSRASLDSAIARLHDHADDFARMSPATKSALLLECVARLADAAPAWVAEGSQVKSLAGLQAAEEWFVGPIPAIRLARLLANSLAVIAEQGKPRLGTGTRYNQRGRLEVELFPDGVFDRVLFAGYDGYALMEEGVDRDAAVRAQAAFYSESEPQGCLAVILGAGNVSSIPACDVLSKMFVDGRSCILKMNPVNEWVGPHLERAFAPLVSRGFLEIVYGGAEVGLRLGRSVCQRLGHEGNLREAEARC